jgi:hypothetical protein
MGSVIFITAVLLVFLGVAGITLYVLFVPIEYEDACIRYCQKSGYEDGFCIESSLKREEIATLEFRENATFTKGPCMLNPLATEMEVTLRCFCRG